MAHTYWPLFDLRLRTPRLELRLPTDDDIAELIETVVLKGIHDPNVMPFMVPWTRMQSPELERRSMQWNWAQRANWSLDDWSLASIAVLDGQIVGMQCISASNFEVSRRCETHSWLGLEYQGRGLGKEMRAAILTLAFEGLGADEAHTDAFEGNGPSIGVSTSLGYAANGRDVAAVEGAPRTRLLFRLTRERWEERTRSLIPVSIENLEPCLHFFRSFSQ